MPPATPLTIPVEEPTVAMVASLLLQAPPEDASVIVIVEPSQTVEAPDTGAGVPVSETDAVL